MFIVFVIPPLFLSLLLGGIAERFFSKRTSATITNMENAVFFGFYALQTLGYGYFLLFMSRMVGLKHLKQYPDINLLTVIVFGLCCALPLYAYYKLQGGDIRYRKKMWFLVGVMPILGFIVGNLTLPQTY